jgi:hypothetical protein
MRALLYEINDLFLRIGGRLATKTDIPLAGTYPDASKFNKLITDFEYDLDKLYTGQKLIEDDVNNLINFNQLQREKSFTTFAVIQQAVYSVYIKSKKDIIGGYEIPGGNPFISSSAMSKDSENVVIDENRTVLTLASTAEIQRTVDTNNVNIFPISTMDISEAKLYPNTVALKSGSHWKKSSDDRHFKDTDNDSVRRDYLTMMIDDPDSSTGVGLCEFELVGTIPCTNIQLSISDQLNTFLSKLSPAYRLLPVKPTTIISPIPIEEMVRVELSKKYNNSSKLIYLDAKNSLQTKYSDRNLLNIISNVFEFKLIIPFLNAAATNQLSVDFSANMNYNSYPKIDWERSKIFANSVAYNFIPVNSDSNTDGLNVGKITSTIVPTRAELIVGYNGLATDLVWPKIGFYMSHYVYSYSYSYFLPAINDEQLKIYITKEYNVFVDSEPNERNEKLRALNVLKGV